MCLCVWTLVFVHMTKKLKHQQSKHTKYEQKKLGKTKWTKLVIKIV